MGFRKDSPLHFVAAAIARCFGQVNFDRGNPLPPKLCDLNVVTRMGYEYLNQQFAVFKFNEKVWHDLIKVPCLRRSAVKFSMLRRVDKP